VNKALLDINKLSIADAIELYRHKLCEAATQYHDNTERSARLEALAELRQRLIERIGLEREYSDKLHERWYFGLRSAGNWFGLMYRSLRYDRLLASPEQQRVIDMRRAALYHAWIELASKYRYKSRKYRYN
jgi:hypothetical protein